MIDLSGIARHLRLSVEKIRIAADLLQQGYQPAFLARYRADETGRLPRATLWALKLDIDRQKRLLATQERLVSQLPKDAELDEEARRYLEQATTEVEMEATLKALRARRTLSLSQGRDTQAGQLLERLIAYDGPPIEDVKQWAAEQFSTDPETSEQLHEQTLRLVSALLHCDTALQEKLRRLIQKKAAIHVELCDPPASGDEADRQASKAEAAQAEPVKREDVKREDVKAEDVKDESASKQVAEAAAVVAEPQATESPTAQPESAQPESAQPASAEPPVATHAQVAASEADVVAEATEASSPDTTETEPTVAAETPAVETPAVDTPAAAEAVVETTQTSEAKLAFGGESKKKSGGKKKKKDAKSGSKKPVAKMTPRQRRRRWLISMLTPMRAMKKPLLKLTAYQRLMLGRGRRSQLVKTSLDYDARSLIPIARDTFVSKDHPLSPWFDAAVATSLDQGLRERMEHDAIADLEEIASEKLLMTAADQLRQTLMRRPVRGHCVLVVDTVGPKAAAVAIVNAAGKVLETCEIPCSVQPQIVSQNVVRLGELVHKHRVTLVALTNGPARRFLVQTVRELMKQSADSGLRWTMADRSGADAYAAGRVALRELSQNNRRDRAAIWVGRSLLDPLAENLKIDVSRLRLGSYQRELPQDSLKQLIRETLADCVCSRGIDTHYATATELSYVPGVGEAQAKQIAAMAGQGSLESRAQLLRDVSDWAESESRQAIGMLRVFESSQPLDATTIHPDDYRLAERLVENTELTMPPAKPEGWEPPKPADDEPKAVTAALAAETPPTTVAPEATDATAEAASAAVVDSGAEAGLEATEVITEAAVQAEASAAEASVTEASATESNVTEASAATEATSEEAIAEDATANAEVATSEIASPAEVAPMASVEAASVEAASVEAAGGPKPEYPEDIAAQVPSPPPVDVEKLARGWQVGREKVRSLVHNLHTPFADPRLFEPSVPMLSDMPTLSNLQPGTCVWAVVVGVAEFGAFVELGPDCSGLVHISRLSADYVEDPHQCVQVGDLLMTWVVSVDEKKNRVALTTLSPNERAAAEAAASERRQEQHADRRGGGNRRGGERSGGNQGAQAGGQRPAGQSGGGGSRGASGGGQRGGSVGRPDGGGRSGGRGRGGPPRGRGQGRPSQPSKPVVVTSKKPKAKITDAMKDGAEPLRSFSDLMQFYEEKRTDDVPPPKSADAPPPVTPEPVVAEQQLPEPASTETNPNSDS